MRYWIFAFLIFPTFLFCENAKAREKLDAFLREYNSGSSVNAPKIYKGQMGGYASAGGVTTKNRVFNRKPLTLTPPSYSAGCAGIDAHMGSFSHIRKEELVEALKDIASNAASYAFLLTMKSVSPQAEDCMRWLQEQANQINALNINSCELAEQAVSAYWPQSVAADQHICRSMGRQSGYFADVAKARHDCSQDGRTKSADEDQGDALICPYNLAWNVIQKDPFLSSKPEFAELFMSITGTVVIDDRGVPHYYPSKIHDATFVKQLFEGGEFECYRCSASEGKTDLENLFSNAQGCLEVFEGLNNFSEKTSFHAEIRKKLESIQISLEENKPLEKADKEMLWKTRLPIGRIVCALTAYHRGRSPVELGTLSDVVTMDIICQFLKDVISNAQLTAIQLRDVQIHGAVLDQFVEGLKGVEKIVLEYEVNSKNLFEEQFEYMKILDVIEKNLRKNIAL